MRFRRFRPFFLIGLVLVTAISLAETRGGLLEDGAAAAAQGDYAAAIGHWSRLLAQPDASGRIEALIGRGEAYRALGHFEDAHIDFAAAVSAAHQAGQPVLEAVATQGLGQVFFLQRDLQEAERLLGAALEQAEQVGQPALAAASANGLGNIAYNRERPVEAEARYDHGLALAQQAEDPGLAAAVLRNRARLARGSAQALTDLVAARDAAATVEMPYEQADLFLGIAVEAQRSISSAYGFIQDYDIKQQAANIASHALFRGFVELAQDALQQALTIADRMDAPRLRSLATGYLGALYEHRKRYAEARFLTEQAIQTAQALEAHELLLEWESQLARLMRGQNDDEGAIAAYRRAVYHIQAIRQDIPVEYYDGHSSFRETLAPIYLGLADLLLQKAAKETDAQIEQRLLREARDTVETIKTSELRDYLKDPCIVARTENIETVSPTQTAIVYPVLLTDRTELLLSLKGGIQQITLPLDRQTLTQAVRNFRSALENRTTREYLPYAQQLYRWLIGPMAAELDEHAIDTLVFVPDGPLRTVPIAALHDGESFLINQYIVATTPGLTLTDFRPIRRHRARLMLNGLTEEVQGFPPLLYVADELDTIQELYGGTRLQDKEFLIDKVREELATTPYSIVHIASHGQFASDVNDTFLLTFDDKLTMDRLAQFMGLSQYREQPVELLTLSACQSAAGDDRAALGLAGIAVKAGARSALATLWVINDQAASLLISQFYRRLQQENLSKAQALQQAQLSLLSDRRYQHPYYWSPFLMIGNWL